MTVTDYDYMLTWFPPETWRSTGLYAAPGETIVINVPQDAKFEGLYVQIGSHTDTLEHIESSERLRPGNILTQTLLNPGENTLMNPYGGLIYFIPTVEPSEPNKSLDVTLSGAIQAIYYKKGETTAKEWEKMRQNNPPPMGELAGDHIIVTVPSKYLLALENPEELLETLDDFVNQVNHLAGYDATDQEHLSPIDPWRYVADIQLSYGYMYCGYPIMLYSEDSVQNLLDVTRFKKNGWGFWHELGHNYQQNTWEVESLVEVTCNIYSLFMEKYYGNPSRLLQDNDGYGRNSYEEAALYLALPDAERDFHDDEKISYFTRLVFFDELAQAYGFEVFSNLAKAFRSRGFIDPSRSVQEKMYDFYEVLSEVTGEDQLERLMRWGLLK